MIISSKQTISMVEAYTASWIEIDWNTGLYISRYVEAYTASWIEMLLLMLTVRAC